jgi:hypothetical protein
MIVIKRSARSRRVGCHESDSIVLQNRKKLVGLAFERKADDPIYEAQTSSIYTLVHNNTLSGVG